MKRITMKVSSRKKISLIGAGQIGSTLALLAAQKNLGDIVLFDINEGIAKGKALDLAQSGAVEKFEANIIGTSSYEDIAESDVVIVTAGVPRKDGMSRDDLLNINANIIKQVGDGIKKYAPNAFVICITNPLDVMVGVLQKQSSLPTNKIVGMAGILDTSRMKFFLSQKLGVSINMIEAFVLGGHGDSMVPVQSSIRIGSISIEEYINKGLITQAELDDIILRTRMGGGEIVKHLGNGSAFYAPAASAIEMAKAYLNDESKILPCAAFLNGEYGYKNIYAGVPVLINKSGVDKIFEISLTSSEKKQLDYSINQVEELTNLLKD